MDALVLTWMHRMHAFACACGCVRVCVRACVCARAYVHACTTLLSVYVCAFVYARVRVCVREIQIEVELMKTTCHIFFFPPPSERRQEMKSCSSWNRPLALSGVTVLSAGV